MALLGELETAPVKEATSRMAAECLTPVAAQELIRKAAARGVERLRAGEAPAPWKVEKPVALTVEFIQSQFADGAALLPGARQEGRRVSYTAADMPEAYRAFRYLVRLA